MMEPLKLSLATFQPEKCYAPYLNTPRSLEACRLNGINPVELVEIPFTEFQKDHPNDLDTANRRFERVDGARRRILASVMKDWGQLCRSGWVDPGTKQKTTKESIVDASPAAHCKLLELQAQKFRRIEEENWTQLQRTLRLEIVRADSEVRNQHILEKHEEIQNSNNEQKREMQMKKDAQIAEQIQRAKDEEERKMNEIREQQEISYHEARRLLEERKINKIRERQVREKREAERVSREGYTQQMKASILASVESKLANRKKLHDIREQNDEQRVKETREKRDRELEEKRRISEARIAQAKEDARRQAEEMQATIVSRLQETERHRLEVEEARQANLRLTAIRSDESAERMAIMKEKAMQQAQDKADATMKALKLRDDLARQELEKVKEAQMKRKTIKALRQEAFAMSAMREKKKEDYRLAKVQKNLENKDERLKAIRQGFNVLSTMRNSMKDIMEKTNHEIKNEMDRLRHSSTFSPNRVVEKAMAVSQAVLFPKLERTFGFVGDDDVPAQRLFDPSSAHFSFDLGDRPNTAGGEELPVRAQTARSPARMATRTPAPTLKIQSLQEDKLKLALMESMRRVEEMHQGNLSRTTSPAGKRSPHATAALADTTDDDALPAILRIQGEDGTFELTQPASVPSPAKGRPVREPGKYQGKSALARSAGDDTRIPLFPFTAGEEFKESAARPQRAAPKKSKSKKFRVDANEKARFLPVPAGKFRREYSTDHPLAERGTGKYSRELNQGLTPTGLPLELEKKAANSVEDNVAEAVELAERVERLTYQAQTSVVDEADDVDKLRKDMNAMMKVLLEEERNAEDERLNVLASMSDQAERAGVEAIFAEERRRASDKIIAATRDYDKTIKLAMLKTMKLGNVQH